MWEYGPAVNGPGHRLVITPESARELRPLTTAIIERAPRLSGWEFYPYRLAENLESAQATVAGRTGGSLDGVVVDARIGEHHLIDLTFRSPRTRNAGDQQSLNDAFVATETLLGEELLDKWVGVIEVAPMRQSGGFLGLFGKAKRQPTAEGSQANSGIRLDQLKEVIDSLVVCLRDQLPSQAPTQSIEPDEETQWSCIELKPQEAVDYPDRTDLIAAVTLNPTMWMAAHCGRPFSSERFSRSGEVFVYVKIDRDDGLEGPQFSDRDEIETAINKALVSDSLGGVSGGGTGIRYSYSDLVLTDRDRGIAVVRKVLRNGGVPKRSWILFFDADLCGEWVGVYDDTPPPPTPDPPDED
ncbi:MAG: hypothetical protein IAG10_29160 [Planctomycetaceae bacterium]|nr:hypothetical protein [Planctomycetaceae bacterium]